MAFGSGAMSNSMDDIAEHAEAVFIIGSNTTEQHPVFGTKLRQAVRRRGAKLVVADPRKIDITEFAALHMRQRPGTDAALLNGIMRWIIEHDRHDREFIGSRCEDFESLAEIVDKCSLEATSDITGVPVEDIALAADLLSSNKPMAVIWAMGITQHTTGVLNVLSLANLQMLLGNMGLPGGGVNPLRGQNNVQGACDMGALPNVYPGYQPVGDAAAHEKFARAWALQTEPTDKLEACPTTPGLTVTEMVEGAGRGDVRALYILGEDPAMSEPDSNHARACLEQAEFVVLQEILNSETADYADVLLTPSYTGVSHERLDRGERLQWPVPSPDHPGTPILHVGKFTRGKGKFHAVEHVDAKELPDDDYPLLFTTGRVLYHWHGGELTRRDAGLATVHPRSLVEISPEDSRRLNIDDDSEIQLRSRRGKMNAVAKVTDRVPTGVVFGTFHFPGLANANNLTISALDPVAKIPEFKVCAVTVEAS